MKPSHLTTPRTLADCTFTYGYATSRPMAYRVAKWEKPAGYALAIAIGVGLAYALFIGLSA